MSYFYIHIRKNFNNTIELEVKGMEAAFETYKRACELAEVANLSVALLYGGEVIATNEEEE